MENFKRLSDHISSVVSGVVADVTTVSDHGWKVDFRYLNTDLSNLVVAFNIVPKEIEAPADDAAQSVKDQYDEDIKVQDVHVREVKGCLSRVPKYKFLYCVAEKWAFVARSQSHLVQANNSQHPFTGTYLRVEFIGDVAGEDTFLEFIR